MIINGVLTITSNIIEARELLLVSKVLYAGENCQDKQFIPASILLPPFEALNAEVNGDMNSYTQIYSNYMVSNKSCFDMLATIIVALHYGTNVTIYVEAGDELSHMNFLYGYIKATYGISAQNCKYGPYMYDNRYDAQNAVLLYSYEDGFITLNEMLPYLSSAGIIVELDKLPHLYPLYKLARDLNIVGSDPGYIINALQNYIARYYSSISNSAAKNVMVFDN